VQMDFKEIILGGFGLDLFVSGYNIMMDVYV
jgi:hypothetical protein